jgi:hypothetical protein
MMPLNLEYVTLNLSTLALSMGETQEKADALLTTFAEQQGITLSDIYFFEFVVTQGSKKHVTYLSMAPVPDGTDSKSGVQVGQLKHQNFVKLVFDEENFRPSLEDPDFGNHLKEALKEKGYQVDMSRVYGLMKKEGSQYIVYFQYK